MTADKPIMSSVIDHAGRVYGFVIRTAKGVRAYDSHERELGLHADEAAAIKAIFNHKQDRAP